MIHINLVLCISNLLQQLYKQDQFINNVEARVEFLETVHRVVYLLFSDEFNLGYRPAFEHVSVAVDQVLSMLLEQIKLAQTNEETEADSLHQLSQIGYLLSKKFDGQLVLAANQKKVGMVKWGLVIKYINSIFLFREYQDIYFDCRQELKKVIERST
jgi:hypothetical protein